MKIVSHLIIPFLLFTSFLDAHEIYPRLRPLNESVMPMNFRTFLKMSGSGQFSKKSLEHLADALPAELTVIVDLRREFHGFINGSAVSWKLKEPVNGQLYEYNVDLSSDQIEEQELALLKQLITHKTETYATDTGSVEFFVETIATERQLAEKLGFKYMRLPIGDHRHPTDIEVDRLLTLIKSLPENAILHFHCAAGEGRTTTLMAMCDIICHPEMPLLDILKRQEDLGGSNLYDPLHHYPNKPDEILRAEQRLDFLKLFSKYCKECPDFSKEWSSWHQ